MDEKQQREMKLKYEQVCKRIAENPPPFIQTEEGLRNLACAMTAASLAIKEFARRFINKFFEETLADCRAYQTVGYRYGKSRRGFKKWLKSKNKRIVPKLLMLLAQKNNPLKNQSKSPITSESPP